MGAGAIDPPMIYAATQTGGNELLSEKEETRPYDRLAEFLILMQIIGATFFQKLAVSLGASELFMSFFLMIALCGFGFVTSRLEIRKTAFLLYLLLFGGLLSTQSLSGYDFSFPSVMLLLTMHLPYIFGLKEGMTRPGVELRFYQKVMLILAILGITQFFLQFVIGKELAFFMDALVPESITKQGFHGMNHLSYGSDIVKSNGVFFLEPSMFSQFLAIAIVIEVIYFRNLMRLFTYLAAIAVTYSGTGLIILFLLIPVYLLQKRRIGVLALMLGVVLTAPMWAPQVGLGRMVERASEFTDPNSSGYARFISMFPFIETHILPDPSALFFGRGAGSIPWKEGDALGNVDYETFNPSWAKLFFEYGTIGVMFYLCFMIYIFKSPPRSGYLKAALIILITILGEYLTPPTVHGIIVALLAWPSRDSIRIFEDEERRKRLERQEQTQA
jgi:hypothetical protein